nr:hypothetical protein [Tanacetum cinerariifolium]
VARRDKRIQARELEIKNLKALLETEEETKRAAEVKNTELMQELKDVRAQFSDLKITSRIFASHSSLPPPYSPCAGHGGDTSTPPHARLFDHFTHSLYPQTAVAQPAAATTKH